MCGARGLLQTSLKLGRHAPMVQRESKAGHPVSGQRARRGGRSEREEQKGPAAYTSVPRSGRGMSVSSREKGAAFSAHRRELMHKAATEQGGARGDAVRRAGGA